MKQVFLSYAHTDGRKAKRLFDDLNRKASIRVWFDRDLLPGQRWEPAILNAIRGSDYFIALLSNQGVSSPGFRHSEVNEALEVAKKFPEEWIFLIPARLDDCRMPFQTMEAFTYADLFPRWADGVDKICTALTHHAASGRDLSKQNRLNLLTVGGGTEPIQIAGSKSQQRRSQVSRVGRQVYQYKIQLVDMGHGTPPMGRIARGLNTVQSLFRFGHKRLAAPRQALAMEDGLPQLYISRLPKPFYKGIGPLEADSVICVTPRLLAREEKRAVYYNNLADQSPDDSRFFFISQSGLGGYAKEAGVTLDTAIAYLITAQLLIYLFDFGYDADFGYHTQTRNCPMDFTEDHSELVPGLRTGRFCRFCSRKLDKIGQFGEAFRAMIAWGR